MGKKLIVGNLPDDTTEQILADTFAQFGTVAVALVEAVANASN